MSGQTRRGRSHKAKQRSDSSSVSEDPTKVKVAHITPRLSVDNIPPHRSAAAHPPACDAGCHCCSAAAQREQSQSGAILSAIIVIDSPAPTARHLLHAASVVEGRLASSSRSAEVHDTAAEQPLSPDSTYHATLPHLVSSPPASPLNATAPTPHHGRTDSQPHHGTLAALSASSSPKVSLSSPQSRSHSPVEPCPLHARSHSLSILQVLREVNHSRNPSVIINVEHTVKEEEKDGAEEQKEQEEPAEGVDEQWKGHVHAEGEKEASVDDSPDTITLNTARINAVDKLECPI